MSEDVMETYTKNVEQDVRSLGLDVPVVRTMVGVRIYFNTEEEMNLYKIAGKYEQGEFLKYIVS